jgi:glycosyltransferase involved in cell wall biosynthesis
MDAKPHVILCYKNFPVAHHVSHIGLGVSSLNTAKVLRANGISTDVWPILGTKTIRDRICSSRIKPTHIIIGAPWLPTLDLQALVFSHPDIHFIVVCHSNVGFLQADPTAIKQFRQCLDLEQGALNFTAAGNSARFANWIEEAYERPCRFLPNLYFLETKEPVYRRPWQGTKIRIGAFGAVRPLKNHLTAAAAALEIANDRHVELEFHINVGRIEGGSTVVRSIEAMLEGHPGVTLVKDPWHHWPIFRKWVRHMDLLMQPSYTESFNMVTADGAAECVPSVVSDAIDWAPNDWKANTDDADDVAKTGSYLLSHMHAGAEGFRALTDYNDRGLLAWTKFLATTMPLS